MGDGSQTSRNIEAVHRLSPVQEGILYQTLLADDPGMYVQQYSCRLTGELDVDVFRSAWDRVTSEHAALRTLIAWRGRESPLRVLRERVEADWHLEDLSELDEESRAGAVDQHASQTRTTGFELDEAPLMRFSLLRLDDRRHRFIWTHHHIILDGWSLNLVLERVFEVYALMLEGVTPKSRPEVSYESFVDNVAGRDRSEADDFWSRYLKGFDEANHLNVSGQAPESPFAPHQLETSLTLSSAESAELETVARRHGVTLDTLLKTAWAVVVSRYSGDSDVVFGSVVSGRPPELDGATSIVGMMINTIPHRVEVRPTMTLRELLAATYANRLQVIEHEWMPLAEIQANSNIPRGRPLFESVLVLENLSPVTMPTDIAIHIDEVQYPQRSNFALALLVHPGTSLELDLLFDPERFSPAAAQALLRHFTRALQSLTGDSDTLIRDIPLLTSEELAAVSRQPEPRSQNPVPVTAQIMRSVERRSEDVAVVSGDESLRYAELGDRARALAHELIALGLSPGDCVALSIDRSVAQIVAITGTLLAGGAYVPLDPSLPAARKRDIVDRVRSPLVVVTSCDAAPDGVDHICLSAAGILDHPTGDSIRLDLPSPNLRDPAYVIHTSGSTGQPKGVPISRMSLGISNEVRLDYYRDAVESFLLLSPYYFDSSVAGIFWTLTTGGKLVLPAPGEEQDIVAVARLIESEGVTHTLMLPSILRLLMSSAPEGALGSLQTVIAAGEPLPPALVEAHRDSGYGWSLYNEYGPTEATVWSTVLNTHHLEPNLPERIPIGSPLPPVGHHVLDGAYQPMPPGAIGELYLSGETLTAGYTDSGGGEPEESFVSARIAGSEAVRLYRTGDLARVDEQGRFDVVGRADRQVKIRGMRVEPGEVEATLMLHPGINSAVVVARGRDADSRLEAFVTASPDVSGGEAIRFVEDRLPGHLVPATVTVVDSIPHTANGKIDYNALEATPPRSRSREAVDETGWTEAQRMVVSFARDLIGDPYVDIGDNFFDAGGHSLLSMHLIARIYKETGARVLPNTVLFNSLGYVAEKIDGESDPVPARSRQTIEPAFIAGAGGPLFTVIHRPPHDARHATLIVPPYGWEYYKTHTALRRLAAALADAGHTVARFDLCGTGDSGGDASNAGFDQWVDDIERTATNLADLTSLQTLNVVGLRLGAGLAALWASRSQPLVSNLVMWDPIIRGADHLDQLRSMHRQFMATKPTNNSHLEQPFELLGSEYSAALRADVTGFQLDTVDLSAVRATSFLSTPDSAASMLLTRTGSDVEVVPDAGGWNDLRTFMWALLPSVIPRRIVDLLRQDDV